jgi:hypothetical protein
MTSSKRTEPTSFINIDLELYSDTDLTEFVDYLSDRLCLLHHGHQGGQHFASFEVRPATSEDEPNVIISAFHAVLSSMPNNFSNAWNACSRKIFDFGYRSGWKPNIYVSPLSAKSVQQLADLKLECVITIYGTSTASKSHRPSA